MPEKIGLAHSLASRCGLIARRDSAQPGYASRVRPKARSFRGVPAFLGDGCKGIINGISRTALACGHLFNPENKIHDLSNKVWIATQSFRVQAKLQRSGLVGECRRACAGRRRAGAGLDRLVDQYTALAQSD